MLVNYKEIKTVSNLISTFRLLLAIPFFFLAARLNESYDYRIITFTLMLIGLLSDLLDGYFARKRNEITEFGKIIDPLADKVCIGIIVIQMYLIGDIPVYFFWIIILRDLIIFTGGILVSRKLKKVLPSNLLGKITVLIIGIFLLYSVITLDRTSSFYTILIYAGIVMSIISVLGYALRAYESLNWNKNETV